MLEAGAFCVLPDGRVAVGTRYGEIYIISGIDDKKPNPSYHLYATGLDEIFGLAYKDDAFYVTQSCELTRVSDTKHDGKANRFETLSDAWGYANYHEYAFGSKFDEKGNLYVALGSVVFLRIVRTVSRFRARRSRPKAKPWPSPAVCAARPASGRTSMAHCCISKAKGRGIARAA